MARALDSIRKDPVFESHSHAKSLLRDELLKRFLALIAQTSLRRSIPWDGQVPK